MPGRRAIALDLPGHGDPRMPPTYDLEIDRERIRAAILEAGLRDPILVGHSAAPPR